VEQTFLEEEEAGLTFLEELTCPVVDSSSRLVYFCR
jgi:hypothetical protein